MVDVKLKDPEEVGGLVDVFLENVNIHEGMAVLMKYQSNIGQYFIMGFLKLFLGLA